jgi:hypothetical protein
VIGLGTEFKLLAALGTVQITLDVISPLKVAGIDHQSPVAHGGSYRSNDLVEKARPIDATITKKVVARCAAHGALTPVLVRADMPPMTPMNTDSFHRCPSVPSVAIEHLSSSCPSCLRGSTLFREAEEAGGTPAPQ